MHDVSSKAFPRDTRPTTAAGQYFQQRRAEFALAAANRALTTMRRGAQLRLEYRGGRPSWSLSGGKQVSAEVAAIIIASERVAPADAALFPDLPPQTWRYAS